MRKNGINFNVTFIQSGFFQPGRIVSNNTSMLLSIRRKTDASTLKVQHSADSSDSLKHHLESCGNMQIPI